MGQILPRGPRKGHRGCDLRPPERWEDTFLFFQPPSLWPLVRTGLATNTSPTPSTAAGKAHVHFSSVWLRPLVSLETVTFWKVVRVSRSSSTCPWHHHPICTQPLGGPVCPCVWEAPLSSHPDTNSPAHLALHLGSVLRLEALSTPLSPRSH